MKGDLRESLGLSLTQCQQKYFFGLCYWVSYRLDKVICVIDRHRDSTWCTALCEHLEENYRARRLGERKKKANTRKQGADIEICWSPGWAMSHHNLCCPHQWCCKFFIPFLIFFIFIPGKDRVLTRWIFVLLLKIHAFQLIVVHLLSGWDVLSSIQPLILQLPERRL